MGAIHDGVDSMCDSNDCAGFELFSHHFLNSRISFSVDSSLAGGKGTIIERIEKKAHNQNIAWNLKRTVASSMMTILDPFSNARAITSNWRCPTLKLPPPSETRSAKDSTRAWFASEEMLPLEAVMEALNPTRRSTS